MTISAVVDAVPNIDGPLANASPLMDPATKSNGQKSISTTEYTPNTDTSVSISRVSSVNSIQNLNRKASLDPEFIETIMD